MKETIEDKFNCLYNETYNSTLKYIVSKCDNLSNVEDIMQNVYIRLFNIMNKKKQNIDNYKAFLIKLSKNELFRYYSLKNKMKVIFNICANDGNNLSIENIKDENTNIDEEILKKISLESIWKIINNQDLITQKIITLYYLEDLKIKEIAQILEISENTIKAKIYRTIQKIKDTLERGENL